MSTEDRMLKLMQTMSEGTNRFAESLGAINQSMVLLMEKYDKNAKEFLQDIKKEVRNIQRDFESFKKEIKKEIFDIYKKSSDNETILIQEKGKTKREWMNIWKAVILSLITLIGGILGTYFFSGKSKNINDSSDKLEIKNDVKRLSNGK